MLSETQNEEITAQARQALRGKWGTVVGATLIVMLLNIMSQNVPYIGPFVWLIVSGAFSLGFAKLYLNIGREEESDFSQIFNGFDHFVPALLTNLLVAIFIVLWTLLFIIPGIMAAYSYMLTFFILADDTSLTPSQAISKSKEMMKGYKWKAFFLSCRFIGWSILALLTLGIGFIWLIPYMGMSIATFYEDIKNNHIETTTNDPQAIIF